MNGKLYFISCVVTLERERERKELTVPEKERGNCPHHTHPQCIIMSYFLWRLCAHICLVHIQTDWQRLNRELLTGFGGLVEFHKSMARRQRGHWNLSVNNFSFFFFTSHRVGDDEDLAKIITWAGFSVVQLNLCC